MYMCTVADASRDSSVSLRARASNSWMRHRPAIAKTRATCVCALRARGSVSNLNTGRFRDVSRDRSMHACKHAHARARMPVPALPLARTQRKVSLQRGWEMAQFAKDDRIQEQEQDAHRSANGRLTTLRTKCEQRQTFQKTAFLKTRPPCDRPLYLQQALLLRSSSVAAAFLSVWASLQEALAAVLS